MLTRHLVALLALIVSILPARVSGISIVSYNVENLFDLDGTASYEDYTPDKYTPRHLLVKARNAAKVLSTVGAGRGPDVVVLNEIEIDQTPDATALKAEDWLDSVKGRTLEEVLSTSPLPPETASFPAEFFLLKALEDAGLGRPDPVDLLAMQGHEQDPDVAGFGFVPQAATEVDRARLRSDLAEDHEVRHGAAPRTRHTLAHGLQPRDHVAVPLQEVDQGLADLEIALHDHDARIHRRQGALGTRRPSDVHANSLPRERHAVVELSQWCHRSLPARSSTTPRTR